MKKSFSHAFVVAGLVGILAVAPGVAHASRALGSVTGVVTAAPTPDRIVVDGRSYRIVPGSAAATERNAVHVGQTVDLVFAPQAPNSAGGASVIGVSVHKAAAQ